MIFASDNWSGVHPQIAAAVVRKTGEFAPAYGQSELCKSVVGRIGEIFETDVSVFLVGTGSIANSLALAAAARPGGVTFCHEDAHIYVDECGAPELFSGGGRLHAVPGPMGKIDKDALREAIKRHPRDFVHHGQPAAISVTQLTEAGTTYSIPEIRAIAEIARDHDVALHMDGARFANALVALDVSPAEMTWKAGIDMLSFGGTKNGCWCAEAIVFFRRELAVDFAFIHKRAGQLYSKMNFLAAQFEAYLEDGLWLTLARHSNAMAERLASHIAASDNLRLAWRPDANEVFAIMSERVMSGLRDGGAVFFAEPRPGAAGQTEFTARLVCSHSTSVEEVDSFGELIRQI